MTAATLARPPAPSFTPSRQRRRRLSHRDPRPLWSEPVPVESAWRAPGFYLAGLIVLPLAAVVAPVRAVLRLF